MHKETKIIISILLCVIMCFIIYFNCGVYYRPVMVSINGSFQMNRDVLEQLNFLKRRMHDGAAADMQKIYPEGYVFMNALYGLAWCDVSEHLRDDSLRHAALEEIDWAYWSIRSDAAKNLFDSSLSLPYGSFYRGWRNYLLGRKLQAEDGYRENLDVIDFKTECEHIALFFNYNNTPYPESYAGSAWPADATMCIASLSLHDRIFEPLYANIIQQWVDKVKANLDSTGLIPHSVSVVTGEPLESARGSSQSLMLNFLPEIDNTFANSQFDLFKKYFLDKRLGIFGVREYPTYSQGSGDIDSGPVVFQLGGAATIVGVRTLAVYGDKGYAASMRNGIEAFGFPLRSSGEKMYLFGKLTIVDAFVVWAQARMILTDKDFVAVKNGFIQFHCYSIVVITLCSIPLFILWKRKRSRKNKYLRIA